MSTTQRLPICEPHVGKLRELSSDDLALADSISEALVECQLAKLTPELVHDADTIARQHSYAAQARGDNVCGFYLMVIDRRMVLVPGLFDAPSRPSFGG